MNRIILLNESNQENKREKILFPHQEDLHRLNVMMQESYDTLLLLQYEFGVSDTNSHFTQLSYLKNNQLFLFCDYENPEHHSFYRHTYNETNLHNHSNIAIMDFFIESRHIQYDLKFLPTASTKRLKI